jgi:predicted TIM-barrel fold metal-dependent hydrolase
MRKPDIFERKAFAGGPLDNCLVIDAHAHIGPLAGTNPVFELYDSSVEGMLAAMNRIGVDIVCPSPFLGISGFAAEGNSVLIEAQRRFPDRFFGYMMADVTHKESIVPDLERCLKAGLRAIKIHSNAGLPYSHGNYTPLFEFANANGLPVLAHTWGAELKDLEKAFSKYKKTIFILAHAGAVDREKYVSAAKSHPNVYLETCFSPCPRGMVEWFVGQGLGDKILWGSDMPFMAAGHQIGRVIFADIPAPAKTKIFGANALKALKIKNAKFRGQKE